jgi:exodeoxyribonuclease VII small subunit
MAEQKFEDALNRLEEIVAGLESGDLNLDDAIKRYEEGMKLAGICARKLEDTRKRIEILVKDASGRHVTKDFKEAVLEGKQADGKPRPAGAKRRPRGEELLF